MRKSIPKTEDIEQYRKRLVEISEMKFGTLSDDDILHTLAERKEISLLEEHEQERLAQEKKEAEEKALQEQKEAEEKVQKEKEASEARVRHEKVSLIEQKITVLNQSISPDKKDDDLLALIQERRTLEEELASLNRSKGPAEVVPEKLIAVVPEETVVPEVPLKEIVSFAQKATPEVSGEHLSDSFPPALARKQEEEFGTEAIESMGINENSQFARYLDQLKSNAGSLGEFLQQLPLEAKKNKAFMLKVAEVDPAYAMHYADPNTLKMDEDFNMRIASLDNPRNSGNALSEMLPDARTSKVLLVAVRRDYRNVKFIEPQMSDYDELISIAKKGTLRRIAELKEAADIDLIVPRILQKDKTFMTEARELASKK